MPDGFSQMNNEALIEAAEKRIKDAMERLQPVQDAYNLFYNISSSAHSKSDNGQTLNQEICNLGHKEIRK